ncbi:unnamed protein product [Ilex paraguariensis]|uniref:Uncharacterized protein n=1 Tax=Ilex paraguariensis TaxID=185542 RepID=A0ABC8T3U0_9AQUA
MTKTGAFVDFRIFTMPRKPSRERHNERNHEVKQNDRLKSIQGRNRKLLCFIEGLAMGRNHQESSFSLVDKDTRGISVILPIK